MDRRQPGAEVRTTGELRNLPSRPHDIMRPVAEMLSPTLGGYALGETIGAVGGAVVGRDWDELAKQGPFAAAALMPAARGAKGKPRAYMTGETIPSAKSGHLAGLTETSDAIKSAHGEMTAWAPQGGVDPVMRAAVGSHDVHGPRQGAYVCELGLETNPLYVSVSPFAPGQAPRLNAASKFKELMDVQDGVPWHAEHPAGTETHFRTNELRPETIKGIAVSDVAISDTGPGGATIFNFDPENPSAAAAAAAAARHGGVSSRMFNSYDPLNWDRRHMGTGQLTRQVDRQLMNSGLAADISGPDVRAAVDRKASADGLFAERYGLVTRSDVQNLRSIFAEKGWPGVQDALSKGAYLPAVGIAVAPFAKSDDQ